jgi:Sulfotransferase family
MTASAVAPIFVGGTGRSGTTIVGRLLGRQHDYTVIPVEARFHCSPNGLPGVLLGEVTPEDFAQTVLEEWYHPPGRSEKLAAFISEDTLGAALAHFTATALTDPEAASRDLILTLFDDYARSQGRRGWVEMTPINVMWGAPHLAGLFPELRLLNVIRDGRDVASSLMRGHEQCRSLPTGSLLTVRFERLLVEDREGGLRELLDFMGWEEEPSLQRFFTRRMPVEEAHVGRWRTHFDGPTRAFVEAEYEAALRRLRAAGVPTP